MSSLSGSSIVSAIDSSIGPWIGSSIGSWQAPRLRSTNRQQQEIGERRFPRRGFLRGRFPAMGVAMSFFVATAAIAGGKTWALPINLDLNRPLQIGWYSIRVQNPFGTNYTGIVAIKSYNNSTKDFVFLDKHGKDVVINESDRKSTRLNSSHSSVSRMPSSA